MLRTARLWPVRSAGNFQAKERKQIHLHFPLNQIFTAEVVGPARSDPEMRTLGNADSLSVTTNIGEDKAENKYHLKSSDIKTERPK